MDPGPDGDGPLLQGETTLTPHAGGPALRWTAFPDDPLECRGLPWLAENLPDLCRLPRGATAILPEGVKQQSRFPSGAYLRLSSDTSELRLRVSCTPVENAPGLDVYVDGRFWTTAPLSAGGEVVCFDSADRQQKDITLYLPLRHEVRITEYGVDGAAECENPTPRTRDLPLVLYGSSVAQGIGCARSGMSYVSILGRSLDVDTINLGFGGAGKAEPDVVTLVNQVDACCYLLDLGKSYGLQSAEAFTTMLSALREAHPRTPIVCATPIFSSRESHSEEYAHLSRHTRDIVRESVAEHLQDGNSLISVVEGETLLGPDDSDGLSRDGVHPNDLGHARITERLQPVISNALEATETRG